MCCAGISVPHINGSSKMMFFIICGVQCFLAGAFGKVYSGSMESDDTRTVVAIKTVKSMKLCTHACSELLTAH